MITNIHIENFKSIQSLDMELGRLNIFIGANGSGKSNILEAIAMGSAAMEDKLDDEFLAHRGVRVTEPNLMKSGFGIDTQKLPIHIVWSNELIPWGLALASTNGHFRNWNIVGGMSDQMSKIEEEQKEEIRKLFIEGGILQEIENDYNNEEDPIVKSFLNAFRNLLVHKSGDFKNIDWINQILPYAKTQTKENILGKLKASDFLSFLIFAPENHFLRRFEEEAAIKPLGIKGEGLFKLLTIIYQENPEQFQKIKEHLKLFDWFQDFEIPSDLKFTERRIKIKDAFLEDGLQYFDQRSANEGFLYLLFYLTLFVSDETPHFFAIDNIDNSLNPKLGSELIRILAKLAKDHKKQALLTTHNPAILDGLDLDDPDQRLFVVYRNADGHTKVRRIQPQNIQNGIKPVRLSEAFIRGYIGGLPDNF